MRILVTTISEKDWRALGAACLPVDALCAGYWLIAPCIPEEDGLLQVHVFDSPRNANIVVRDDSAWLPQTIEHWAAVNKHAGKPKWVLGWGNDDFISGRIAARLTFPFR